MSAGNEREFIDHLQSKEGKEQAMKCYRVWFMDGSAMLVDAASDDEAIDMAEHKAKEQDWKHSFKARTAKRVECLTQKEGKL